MQSESRPDLQDPGLTFQTFDLKWKSSMVKGVTALARLGRSSSDRDVSVIENHYSIRKFIFCGAR